MSYGNTGLTAGRIMRAGTSHTVRNRRGPDGVVTQVVGLVHLTDGERFSRTGRNLRALCGTSVRPDRIGEELLDAGRLCPKCRRERDARIDAAIEARSSSSGPGFARFEADDSPAEVERKMAEAFAPVHAAREALVADANREAVLTDVDLERGSVGPVTSAPWPTEVDQ